MRTKWDYKEHPASDRTREEQRGSPRTGVDLGGLGRTRGDRGGPEGIEEDQRGSRRTTGDLGGLEGTGQD